MTRPSLLTTADAARQLGISERRVRVLCAAGRIRADRIGRAWLVRTGRDGRVRVRAEKHGPKGTWAG